MTSAVTQVQQTNTIAMCVQFHVFYEFTIDHVLSVNFILKSKSKIAKWGPKIKLTKPLLANNSLLNPHSKTQGCWAGLSHVNQVHV